MNPISQWVLHCYAQQLRVALLHLVSWWESRQRRIDRPAYLLALAWWHASQATPRIWKVWGRGCWPVPVEMLWHSWLTNDVSGSVSWPVLSDDIAPFFCDECSAFIMSPPLLKILDNDLSVFLDHQANGNEAFPDYTKCSLSNPMWGTT